MKHRNLQCSTASRHHGKANVVGRLGSRHAALETKEHLQLPLAHRSKPSPKPFRELDCQEHSRRQSVLVLIDF